MNHLGISTPASHAGCATLPPIVDLGVKNSPTLSAAVVTGSLLFKVDRPLISHVVGTVLCSPCAAMAVVSTLGCTTPAPIGRNSDGTHDAGSAVGACCCPDKLSGVAFGLSPPLSSLTAPYVGSATLTPFGSAAGTWALITYKSLAPAVTSGSPITASG